MEEDAAAVGVWENEYTGRNDPRLQILTLAELFQGKRPVIPWVDVTMQKSAPREASAKQGRLLQAALCHGPLCHGPLPRHAGEGLTRGAPAMIWCSPRPERGTP